MSCLFNSLSHFINETSFTIRQKICDYLENNNPIIEGVDTKFILQMESNNNNYISMMRNTSTWGGAIEIQVACILWNLRIIVKNNRDAKNTIIEFLPLRQNNHSDNHTEYKTIVLEWTGGHYEPERV